MSFDVWHPECTATCFVFVTIIEIHSLILDVCVLIWYIFINLIIWILLKRLKMVFSTITVLF